MPLASAGVQVPPAWGVPPSELNKSCEGLFVQKDTLPSCPAFAFGAMVTVTTAVSLGHGAAPLTVYVYVHGVSTNGLKTPVPLCIDGDQVPPGWAETPNNENRSCGILEHIATAASFPAFGGGMIDMVTDAVSLGHGAVPVTV